MDISHILNPLNDAQREAVTLPPGPALVLAGAGSGKTRVLTHRISWLMQAEDISPLNILAVTFTNKAAREMRGRIAELLQFPVDGLWIGTFHGLCYRLLRMYFIEAGLPEGFEIIDSEDQLRLIRRTLADMDLDEARWPPRQLQGNINRHKEEGLRSKHLPDSDQYYQRQLKSVYATYEETCQRLGLVDFAEILLRTLDLFKSNQEIRERLQHRFRHVLVDEFQDTNHTQYQWLRVLSETQRNLFAVGDDDQSIYSWRGANIGHMLNFEKDYPDTRIIRLEQNYRSSGHILDAANAVIDNNSGRLGKNLWTSAGQGDPVCLFSAYSGVDEARFVIGAIQHWHRNGNRRDSVAILYRSNAQSRSFEDVLLSESIPYRVYGGLRFFERAEIKDALAYMRLISNRDSDPSFERVVNLPPRGIGARTMEVIRNRSRATGISLWKSSLDVLSKGELPARAAKAVQKFLELIDNLDKEVADLPLGELTEAVLKTSTLLNFYGREKSDRAEDRVENLRELVTAADNFLPSETDEDSAKPLALFLTNAMLDAGEGQAEEWEDCVQLMSMHSAKGLEFRMVFLCGLEEGLFPNRKSVEEEDRLEEERRLFYVGMTRAMEKLYLCHARMRQLYGQYHYERPSRFLHEVPLEHTETVQGDFLHGFVQGQQASDSSRSGIGLQPGSMVRHSKFGEGTVVTLEGQGDHVRAKINFTEVGAKWILPSYAKMEVI